PKVDLVVQCVSGSSPFLSPRSRVLALVPLLPALLRDPFGRHERQSGDADQVEVAEAGGVLGLSVTLIALRERHREVVAARAAFVLPNRCLDVVFLNLVKRFGQSTALLLLVKEWTHLDLLRPAH